MLMALTPCETDAELQNPVPTDMIVAMEHPSCEECQALYKELLKASRATWERRPDESTAPLALAVWLEQLNEEECARMRETSSLWATWRKLREHRALSGHYLPVLSLAPQAISNSN